MPKPANPGQPVNCAPRWQTPKRRSHWRPRPQRWHDAVAVLVELQAQYQIWLDGLPPNLEDGATADALREVCGLDLAELEGLTLPRGFGRD